MPMRWQLRVIGKCWTMITDKLLSLASQPWSLSTCLQVAGSAVWCGCGIWRAGKLRPNLTESKQYRRKPDLLATPKM